jgi:hypothetical protein
MEISKMNGSLEGVAGSQQFKKIDRYGNLEYTYKDD